MRYFISIFIASVCYANILICQTTFPNNVAPNGTHTIYVFTNCTLHVDADVVIAHATIIIQDKKIVSVSEKQLLPKEAVCVDLKGKHIYPAFIDLYSEYGMPEVKKTDRLDFPKKGAFGFNQAIKSDVEGYKLFSHNQATADEYRKQGFAAVVTSQKDGIVRGSGALVCLAQSKENETMIKDRTAAFYSLRKGTSPQDYPSSLM